MNFTSILIHFVGAALSCAQLAYWSIRLMTPPPAAAPVPARAVPVRDPDPVLAARAVLLGQEVTPGATLVEVNPQSVTLQTGPTRRELRVPNPPLASFSGAG